MTDSPPKNLILACCHAIYLPGPTCGLNPEDWLLAPFQTGDTPCFISHAQTGLRLLATTPSSLLIFSGSKTRPEIDRSEARSYLDLCISNNFWGIINGKPDSEERNRIFLDEQALDSFGNLLFGLLAFWKRARRWPERVWVVSHEFKRRRFMELHVGVLRFPRDKVEFVGVDPSYMREGSKDYDEERKKDVEKGEMERGFKAWERDRLGVGVLLKGKRVGRNPWGVSQVWFKSEEERRESRVKSEVVKYEHTIAARGALTVVEEFLTDDEQPWEVTASEVP